MNEKCMHGMPKTWCSKCGQPKGSGTFIGPAKRPAKARHAASGGIPTEYTGADLKHLYHVDQATGCWLWSGEFRTYGQSEREVPIIRVSGGRHRMCGIAHNAMSRTFFEEQLGRPLTRNENVVPTCASNRGRRHACVSPDHHEIRSGAGVMFGHDMQE